MSYNTELQSNNAELAEILAAVNDLPEDGSATDEWILIGDVTSEEEVNSFKFTKDINGDSFACKRIVANMIFPEVPSSKGITISVNTSSSQWGSEIFANNIGGTCLRYFMNVELIQNAVILEFAENGDSSVNQDFIPGKYLSATELTELTHFGVFNGWEGTETFPVGTQITVWGLKK